MFLVGIGIWAWLEKVIILYNFLSTNLKILISSSNEFYLIFVLKVTKLFIFYNNKF